VGSYFWIPLDYLRKFSFGVGVHVFHIWKPLSTCSYFFSSPLYIFCHEFEWQIPGVCKIQRWGPIFWIPLNYFPKFFWSTSSCFSRMKTISNLCVFFFLLFTFFVMSLNGKYWGSVKYNVGVLFFGFIWITCIKFLEVGFYGFDVW